MYGINIVEKIKMASTNSLRQFRDLVSHVFRLTMSLHPHQQQSSQNDPSRHFDEFLNSALTILNDKEQVLQMHSVLENHADRVYSDVMLGREMFEPQPTTATHEHRFVPVHMSESGYNAPTLVIHQDSKPTPIQAADVVVTKADEDCETKEVSTFNETSKVTEVEEAEEEGELVEEVEETVEGTEEAEEAEEEVEEEVEEAEEEVEEAEEEVEEAEEEVEEEVKEAEEAEGEVVEEVEEEVEEAEEEGEVVEEEVEEAEEEGEVVEEEVEEAEEEGEVVEEEAEEEVEEEAEEEAEEEGVTLIKIGRKKYFVGEHSKLVYAAIDDDTPGEEPLGRYDNGKITQL
jgi:hypothetical protein